MPSAPAIRIEYQPSLWQRRLSFGLVAGAGLALLLAPWPEWKRVLAFTGYVCVVLVARRHLRTRGWRTLLWAPDGRWHLVLDDGQSHEGTLLEARLFGPLVALRFQAGGSRLRILLWPDSAGADELRRLRIRLAREAGPTHGGEG